MSYKKDDSKMVSGVPVTYRKRVQVLFSENDDNARSRTQQHFKDECDFNKIISKFQKTGLLTHVKQYEGQYGDFSMVPSYEEALDRINAAHEMFMTVPSKIRAEFDHNPGKFLAFVEDPANEEKMRELGLLKLTPEIETQIRDSIENTHIVKE